MLLTSMFVLLFGLSGWAVLAAGALVASLLAVGASPAGAATDTADHEAKTGACVGDALSDQMFTDVSDMHAFKDAINCIAYYGITNGTGDGSTYSPNNDVTRAEMAVFIARAAGVAGVDLGDAMGDEFDDLDGVWQEARDAINQLADNGMISSGGDYRPDDAVTRAEMAHFLVGLLVEASPNVKMANGMILLGSGQGAAADDWFGDARAALPRANDAEVSAIYELGITKGASAAAGAEEGKPPLDSNYEPHGTVDRGQMAAFITRALAHTAARPEGISAQYADGELIISARDANFAPMPDTVVDVFQIATSDADLAFRANGACAEVEAVSGNHRCEIDSGDDETDNDGDIMAGRLTVGQGLSVWAWTGDTGDTVGGDTDLFRLDIPKGADAAAVATRVHVGTDFSASLVHVGSSVVYTVQLQSAAGRSTTVGTDGKKPATFEVLLSTYAMADTTDDNTENPTRGATALSVSREKITTDAEGKATFTVSAPADTAPSARQHKFQVDVSIDPLDNAPGDGSFYTTADGTTAITGVANGFVPVRSGTADLTATPVTGALVFSTDESTRATTGTVTLTTAAEYVLASARGASNSATVKIVDQYGDPISGASITLAHTSDTDTAATTTISRPTRITSRDGTRTFRYERIGAAAGTQVLTVTWDPDGPDATAATVVTMTANVEWATFGTSTAGTAVAIREFDKDTNTIFAGANGSVAMYTYDSNDRFNAGASGSSDTASSYAAFERQLYVSPSTTGNLNVTITGSRSSATNTFELITGVS